MDPLLLAGNALFFDDVELSNVAHAAIVRSPYAHARIDSVDESWALVQQGIISIYTADDLGDFWSKGPLNVSPAPIEGLIFYERIHPILANDEVRFVGEPVAIIVAESRYLAGDALPSVDIDFEPLPAVLDIEQALEADSPLVYEDVGSNIAAHCIQERVPENDQG